MIPNIHWYRTSEKLPDSDRTVLIHNPGWLENPVWVGHSGETPYRGPVWFDADGFELDARPGADPADAAPTHWAEMPASPANGWGPELQPLAHLRPELVCGHIKQGRVVLQSGEQLITLCLCPSANAAPKASAILSLDEATHLAGKLCAQVIAARNQAPTKEEAP